MAFNPFHRFRKHQKVVFAALTIICMLTFVFTSGVSTGGDFFSELQRMIGVRSRTTEEARLYGKPVDRAELIRLREQRRLANQFMALALDQALFNILQEVQRSVPEFDTALKSQLQQILQTRSFAAQLAAMGYPGYESYQRQLFGYLNQLEALIERLRSEKKSDAADKILRFRDMLQRDILRTQFHDDLYPGSGLYFGGSLSAEGLLDFMIWQRQADELGIALSTHDIKEEFKRETMHLLTPEQEAEIQSNMRLGRGDTARLLEALGAEFRVRLAQAALVGYDSSGTTRTPAPVTPYELWQYYERNRTEASVDILPVPVASFMAKAKAPTAEELRALFEKYKDVEPSPEKDTPGFKLPERVAVEWVAASPSAPSYEAAARNTLLGAIGQIPINPLPAVAVYYHLGEKYRKALEDFQSQESFDNQKWNYFKIPSWTEADFRPSLATYRSLQRHETVASALGQLTGALALFSSAASRVGSVFQVPTAVQGAAVAREMPALTAVISTEAERRIPFVVSLFGAGTAKAPWITASGIVHYASTLNQHLPLSLVQADMLRKLQEGLAGTFVTESLDSFKRELEALKKDQPELIKKTTAKYGWKHGSSTGLDDKYHIADDPGLKPLEEAYLGKDRLQDFRDAQRFADIFFIERKDQKTKLYKPVNLPTSSSTRDDQSGYVYWRTGEKLPETITFEEAKKQVEEAWRLEQARKLAKAEAEKIAEQAREAKGDALRNLTDAAKQLNQQLIHLDAIARLSASPLARAGLGSQYDAYKVPEDKIRYPSVDFVDRILDELTLKGDVIVQRDQPGRSYYVVALAQRDPASMKEFRQAMLLDQLTQEQRKKYRGLIRDTLREQAGFWMNEELPKEFEDRRMAAD